MIHNSNHREGKEIKKSSLMQINNNLFETRSMEKGLILTPLVAVTYPKGHRSRMKIRRR